jgi:glucose/arabinose dehydrogenase/plastocyanin
VFRAIEISSKNPIMKQLLLLISALAGITVASRGATHSVNIVNFAFSPANISVQVSDSVRWTQSDAFTFHTSTSGEGGTPNGLWDSGFLAQGQTFTHTFSSAGNFPYFCAPHFDTMIGSVTVSGGGNTAPSVAITNPTNGAVFNGPTNLTVAATATDTNGSVAQVEFFDGTNSLGADTTSPYSVSATFALGSHVLTAIATDNLGSAATSAPVNITVRSTPIDNPIVARIPKGDITIELQTVLDGLASPLGMAAPDDGSGRMFVYDQSGLVWVVTAAGAKLPVPLLDVRGRLVPLGAYDERGLLGMATHPNFAQNPLIYTYTSETSAGAADFTTQLTPGTTNDHQSVIAEWRISIGTSNQVDMASRREILRIDQPQSNHNGGTIRFGNDGFLYIALGDGGQADDQGNGHVEGGNAQFLENVYGKFLRIDVDARTSANGQYGVPSDNPFVGAPGIDEIYAYGFRNPYTFSFDRVSGVAFVADVGQNKIEEIDLLVKGGNFGWNVKEGTFFFDPNGAGSGYVTATPVRPVPPDLIDPLAEYDHDDGLAAVGGYVYRGSQVTNIANRYVFGDWGTFSTPAGRLFYIDGDNSIKEFRIGLADRSLGFWLKGFGEDADGELYVFGARSLGPAGNTGRMFKIAPAPKPIEVTNIVKVSTNIDMAWCGGTGPFAAQKKNALNDPMWINASFVTNRAAVVPANANAAFFRVSDAANHPAIPLTVILSGAAERPNPVTNTTAIGSGSFALEGNVLRFDIRYSGLSSNSTAAHIHGPATAGGFTGVMIDLQPFHLGPFGTTSGAFSGSIILSPPQKAAILAGQTYVNVHSSAHQGGEIRGQIAPVAFQASMSVANERPDPVTDSNGRGSATFALVGNQLTFNISYRDLSGPASAAHIHGPADDSGTADVMINLAPFSGGSFGASGNLAGSVALTDAQLAAVVDGLTYVNFHTTLHTAGEIRGQVRPQTTAVPLTAILSGLSERPTPVTNSAGTGSATFTLEGDTLNFNIRYAGLSAGSMASHIHGPAPAGGFATVMIDLAPFHFGGFGTTNGTISGRVLLTPAQKSAMLNGLTYVNVHSTTFTGGEIRGQIAPVLMQSSLAGGNERPNPIVTPGNGSAVLTLVRDQLGFNITYRDLLSAATAAHFHGPAGFFQTENVRINLAPFSGGSFGIQGSVAGTTSLVSSNLASVIDGLFYINFHTTNNPNGEIRGQVTR